MAMEFRPVGYRVLVEQKKRDDLGILIPDSADDFGLFRRTVLAVGEPHLTATGRELPIPVKVGDEILVDLHNPQRFMPIPIVLSPKDASGERRSLAILDCEAIKCVCSGTPEKLTGQIIAPPKPGKVLVH